MGKGIVKKKPFITSTKHTGSIQVTSLHPGEDAALLGKEIAFDMPTFVVEVDEYVEFIQIASGEAHVTKSILSKGIVRRAPDEQSSTGVLMVTVAIPTAPNVTVNMDLTFYNPAGLTLYQNDYVEFYGVSTQSGTLPTHCSISRRIDCHGIIIMMPGQFPGLVDVMQVGGGSSQEVRVHDHLRFLKPATNFDQIQLSNKIEFKVVSNTLGEYVQVLNTV